MSIAEILLIIRTLAGVAEGALAAGRDVTDAEVDAAMAALGASRTRLEDAIARARAREDGP